MIISKISKKKTPSISEKFCAMRFEPRPLGVNEVSEPAELILIQFDNFHFIVSANIRLFFE
jgi:hypothetical protein